MKTFEIIEFVEGEHTKRFTISRLKARAGARLALKLLSYVVDSNEFSGEAIQQALHDRMQTGIVLDATSEEVKNVHMSLLNNPVLLITHIIKNIIVKIDEKGTFDEILSELLQSIFYGEGQSRTELSIDNIDSYVDYPVNLIKIVTKSLELNYLGNFLSPKD